MTWNAEGLEEQSPIPLWFQIAQRLRQAILDGEFAAGEMLPSEAVLNERFEVSRTTSRAALNSLQEQGYVRRRSGRGSIVLPLRVDQPLKSLRGFAEDMRARGLRAGYATHDIREVKADVDTVEAFAIPPGSAVLRISRTLVADDAPIADSTAMLNLHGFPPGPTPTRGELDSGSLYEWLNDHYGIRLVSGYQSIGAALADSRTAAALSLAQGAPVLVVRRVSFDAKGVPVEYVTMRYDAARYQLRIELPAS